MELADMIFTGDVREYLPTVLSESVHTCVTSPPYWGLRDYGVEGQIGLEQTPEQYVTEMVEVFREVKRVLRDDGTLWLNLGDSYAGGASGLTRDSLPDVIGAPRGHGRESKGMIRKREPVVGLKPKDLVGIPWRVAFALQQPYYSGRIKNEHDRIWLAAMIDTEGCMFIHKRKEGQSNGQGYFRQNANFAPGLEVANCSETIVKRCMEITGLGSICTQGPEQNYKRKQPIFRWNLRTTECRDVVREVYPYLVAKQHQARIMCGCPSSGEKAEAAHEALKILHNGGLTDVDFPAPASMFEPGYYLRSDIIWSKLNPMPESVTDRPTKAHEYIFLLSKSKSYYYDADGIREPLVTPVEMRGKEGWGASNPLHQTPNGTHGPSARGEGRCGENPAGRNKRTVWTIATAPFKGAHFATFPPKLIEPCILAGAPEKCCAVCGAPWVREVERGELIAMNKRGLTDGGTVKERQKFAEGIPAYADRWEGKPGRAYERKTLGFLPSCTCNAGTVGGLVLDPFTGAGTTGLVALQHGRRFIGCELNPAYAEMARERIAKVQIPLTV